ncbi:hypothetical protein OG345_00420 [Streptomyces sp. NBC_01220]|nr:hypothetical protein OG345_00420 [Streptomyces sp. NBC_01220]
MAWRLARMVLLSAQGMPVAKITEVTFTSPDRVRALTQNFNTALAAEGVVDEVRIAVVRDNYSPPLTTKRCLRVATWVDGNNVEIAYTPTNYSWLNRIEAQFTALRYFALDGTDDASRKEQGSIISRYIIWWNKHAADERMREVVNRANVA